MSLSVMLSDDGLSARGEYRGRTARIYWDSLNEVPDLKKMEEIFFRLFATDEELASSAKKISLTKNYDATFFKSSKRDADEATFWFGRKILIIPFKDGRMDVHSSRIVRGGMRIYGAGGRTRAAFFSITKKLNKSRSQ